MTACHWYRQPVQIGGEQVAELTGADSLELLGAGLEIVHLQRAPGEQFGSQNTEEEQQ